MRSPLRFLPFLLLPVSALLAACTATRTVERAELSPPNPLPRVWVTRVDHSTVVFDAPRVSADTLIGTVAGQPQRLPFSEVTALRVLVPLPDRTAGLVFLGVAGMAALVVHFFEYHPTYGPCGPPVDCCPASQPDCL